MTELTQQIVNDFYPYIFSHKSISKTKIDFFIKNVFESKLLQTIPKSVIIENNLYLNFSVRNLTRYITKLHDEELKIILPHIEESFLKAGYIDRVLSVILVHQYLKVGIKLKYIDTLLSFFKAKDMNEKIWKYLDKYDIVLPEKLAESIVDFPDNICLVKIMPKPEKLPSNIISNCLMNATDLKIYEHALISDNINCPEMATAQFWSHVISIVSSSTDDENFESGCSIYLLNRFRFYFEKFVSLQNFAKVFEDIVLDIYPPNERGSNFIVSLFCNLNYAYRSSHFSIDNSTSFNDKIFQKKGIPPPYFCKLIHFVNFRINIRNPLLLYIFEFSKTRNNYNYQFKEVFILTQTNESIVNIIEFIKRDDFMKIIQNMDENALSLIACAFTFTHNNLITKINGLTDDLVLPFFAIAFKYINVCKCQKFYMTNEMLNQLKLAFKNSTNNDSELQNVSIDSILSNINHFCNNKFIPNDASFYIIDILISNLLNGSYNADKSILISIICKLSCNDEENCQIQTLAIIDKYGKKLLEYIFQEFTNLNYEKISECNLNLLCFGTFSIKNLYLNIIQDSKSEKIVVNAIDFIENHCNFTPNIKVQNKQNLIGVFNSLIDNEKWDDALLVSNFMKKHQLSNEIKKIKNKPIPFNIKKQMLSYESLDVNEIISDVLSNKNPEKNKSAFECLFKIFMKDLTISINYITILLESITENLRMNASELFNQLQFEYTSYQKGFKRAIIRSYALSYNKKNFVKKLIINQLLLSKFADPILAKLYECGNYQSFICLLNIASCFPFLFSEKPNKLFDIVLPKLSNISLIFSFQGEDEIADKIKTSISALTFLFTCLYSTKIIQSFIPFVFENIIKLDDSQVFSLIIVLHSLFDTNEINSIILSLAIKYKFLNVVQNLLKRNIKEELFKKTFMINLFKLVNKYFVLISKIDKTSDVENLGNKKLIKYLNFPLVIDQYQKISNPFEISFNGNSTILPIKLKQLIIPFPVNKDHLFDPIIQFTNAINEVKKCYIYFERSKLNQQFSNTCFNSFMKYFSDHGTNISKKEFPSFIIPQKITIKMFRYISSKPFWMINWIFKDEHDFLPEHLNALKNYYNDLKQIEKKTDIDYSTFNLEKFKLNEFCYEPFLKAIIVFVSEYENKNETLLELVKMIPKMNKTFLTIFNIINQYILNENMQKDLFSSSESIGNLMNFIYELSKDNKCAIIIKNDFIKLIGKTLFTVILSPHYRINSLLLFDVCKVFCKLNIEIPNCATHLIGFMLLSNDSKVIQSALELYSKMKKEKTSNLKQIIKFTFDEEISENPPSYITIKSFIDRVPSLVEKSNKKIFKVLKSSISLYQKEPDLDLLDLICSLFNYLSPDRKELQTIITTENTGIDFSLSLSVACGKSMSFDDDEQETVLKPAPQSLIDTSPTFWKLYQNQRMFINKLIGNDVMNLEKFTFLIEYFELVVFRFRSLYFKEKIKNRISKTYLFIDVSRSNILNDSFHKLHNLPPTALLKCFNVHFLGENGIDAGGLTKEWFTLIVREFLKAKNSLFIKTESQSYLPNQDSKCTSKNLEYYKFAGTIIARALIGGHCVNAHFSISFLRQILHRLPKLRDLEDYSEQIYNSFQHLLNNDVDPFEFTFAINAKKSNDLIPLKKNGENILVTNENKLEYVSLYTLYHLKTSISKQIKAFSQGFDALIPHDFIKIFSPRELDLLICGTPEVDLEDMRRNTIYNIPYNENHPVINMFFNVLLSWENENIGKLLHFWTGSSQVPINGFAELRLKISPMDNRNAYPKSHTCFNILELPPYENEDIMNNKLLEAIQIDEFDDY